MATHLSGFLENHDRVSVVLMDAGSGEIIFEKNAHVKKNPYSNTKLASAVFFIEKYNPDLKKRIKVQASDITNLEGGTIGHSGRNKQSSKGLASRMGLQEGDLISLDSLLKGMLLPSGFDAANVIARSCELNASVFVNKLNQYLKNLGCLNTHFTNPHGYPNADHYTTAYDLALIAKRALVFPKLMSVVCKSYDSCDVISKIGQIRRIPLEQTNKLLIPGSYYYPYAYGLKTGSSLPVSHNLIAAAKKGDHNFILVILDAATDKARYELAIKFLNSAFAF